jgi:hypothetical protein
MSAYHEGISARKQGRGEHENPYIGETVGFTDWVFSPGIFSSNEHPRVKKVDWDKGWTAEDKFRRKAGEGGTPE